MLFNASMELMLYNLELYNSIAIVIRSLFLKVLTSVTHFPLNMNKTFNMGSFHPVCPLWLSASEVIS